MIYLPEELELLLKTTMKLIGFKRNSGNLEINEYEVTSNKSDYFCGGLIMTFTVNMVFEEKNKKFFNKDFQDELNSNFAVADVNSSNIDNNRVLVSMSLTQIITN